MFQKKHSSYLLYGFQKNLILFIIWLSIAFHFIKIYKNPFLFIRIRKQILKLKQLYTANYGITKLAFVDGKYYFNSNMNGWPSKSFYRPLEIEVKKCFNQKITNLENLKIIQIALTKKCPLNCEHCFEGHELNKKDTLTLNDHKLIIEKIQKAGISVIQYGGGEPMTHVDDLIEILKSASNISDFYVYTSGFNCNIKNLEKLKSHGLTGISIGIDHFLPEKHNSFRRNDKAFQWAIDAAKNAQELKLVLTYTICVTKEFCTEENLMKYLEFAKENRASFIQLLEPRAVGNYENKDVNLSNNQIKILENFFLKSNSESKFKDYPIVLYTGYHQRKKGCLGAGENYIYIDTDGYMSSCPFCKNLKTHILDESHDNSILSLKSEGCALPKINN